MPGLVCHIGDSSVTGNQLRSLPRRTHSQTQVIRTSPLPSFASGRKSTRSPGVSPFFSTQIPIQTGLSAPTAAWGGWVWVPMRAPVCFEPSLKYEIVYMLGLLCHPGDSGVAGNQTRSSRMLEFFAVLVLPAPCTYLFIDPLQEILAQPAPQGTSTITWYEICLLYRFSPLRPYSTRKWYEIV